LKDIRMDIRIAGGHGTVARLLTRQLVALGHDVTGFIRDPGQAADLNSDGATPVVLDLEQSNVDEVTAAIRGADAVLFAAGSGPGSGPARKWSVDHGGAVLLLHAAVAGDVERYVIISSMGAGNPPPERDDEGDFAVYLRAKATADEAVMASDRAWTVVRPGGLTDGAATGTVTVAREVEPGQITRADVASVLRRCLDDPRTAGHVLSVIGGSDPIDVAIDAVVR
jgi:nucleoside-diphosphate-sugar epimerase